MNHLEYIQGLISKGIWSFSSEEIEKAIGRKPRDLLFQLRNKGRIISPGRGFFAIVPEEYINSDRLPVERYIDSFMRYCNRPYYVGLLTAADYYGAAHQSPQVFQVVMDRDKRNIRVNKNRIQFFRKSEIGLFPVRKRRTATGYFNISSPGITLLDLIEYNNSIGGLDRVATIALEIESQIKVRDISEILPLYSNPIIQRCGFVLETLGIERLCRPIDQYLSSRKVIYSPLRPSGSKIRENRSTRWKLFINDRISVDL